MYDERVRGSTSYLIFESILRSQITFFATLRCNSCGSWYYPYWGTSQYSTKTAVFLLWNCTTSWGMGRLLSSWNSGIIPRDVPRENFHYFCIFWSSNIRKTLHFPCRNSNMVPHKLMVDANTAELSVRLNTWWMILAGRSIWMIFFFYVLHELSGQSWWPSSDLKRFCYCRAHLCICRWKSASSFEI